MLALILCGILLCSPLSLGREMNFRKIAMCHDKRNFSLIFDKFLLRRNAQGKVTALSFDMTVKKQINRLGGTLTISKCDLSGNPDTCEYFLKDRNNNMICELMGKNNQLWTDFVDHMPLPKQCPIKTGKYHTSDAPVGDAKVMDFLPLPKALWKLNLKAYDELNTYLSCLDMEFEILTGRGN